MANAQPDAPEEQQGGGWYKTLLNVVMIYFVINGISSFLSGRMGTQTDGDTGASKGGPAPIPALWSLGTKMV
jgi:hypothetical protein